MKALSWTEQCLRMARYAAFVSVAVACGDEVTGNEPDPPAEKDFIVMARLASGSWHSCAVSGAGSGVPEGTAYCWGRNDDGQLGTGIQSPGDQRTLPSQVIGGQQFIRLAAGLDYSCGISFLTQAWCWGAGPAGQSGAQPVLVSPIIFQRLSGGDGHVCASTDSDELYCWGRNTDGQLGDGTQQDRNTVTAVGLTINSVAAGAAHTCAAETGGTTWCWGRNDDGQLGLGFTGGDPVLEPTVIDASAPALTRLTAGTAHTCGLTVDGDAYCWGSNGNGQLGSTAAGSATDVPVPVEGGIRFRTISAGARHTCGVDFDDVGYCWGANDARQLGLLDLDVMMRSVPDSVHFEKGFQVIVAGGNHTCATSADLGFCWGNNDFGQLGDGTTIDRLIPGRVLGSP